MNAEVRLLTSPDEEGLKNSTVMKVEIQNGLLNSVKVQVHHLPSTEEAPPFISEGLILCVF